MRASPVLALHPRPRARFASAAILAFAAVLGLAPPARAGEPRVVVMLVEGLDAERAAALPALAALADEGARHRVRALPGVETPAVQVALLTGVSPAESGVLGYVVRMQARSGPIPYFGHVAPTIFELAGGEPLDELAHDALRDAIPCLRTTNEAPFVWEHAARAGVASVVLRAPMAFDRPVVAGARVLFGAGYPDARGALGDWFVYTSAEDEHHAAPDGRGTSTAGTVFAVARTAEGFASQVLGPPDFARKADLERDVAEVARRLDDPELDYAASLDLIGEQRELEDEIAALARGVALPLAIAPGEDGADVRIGAETQRVALGAWSEPFHPVFALSHGIEVHALTRVKLVALEPLRLYVHRLDLDPAHAPFWQPASAPPAFAAELAAAHGPFETYGWTTATMPYKDGEADAATVIESAGWTLERERELWRGAVAREDWRLLIGTFGVGTHLRSVLTHLAEPGHPLHDAGAAAATARFLGADVRAGGAVDAAYAALDALVGETRAKLREGDVLLVVSPNGIASFRRQVHLNNWLAAEGFLTPGSRSANGLASVDWGATRAYALGLGGIHLNLAGREAQGIVAEDDANDVLDAIAEKLLAARDPETGAPLVTAVHRPRELWSGVHAEMLPDLVVGFAPPYRVSWATTLGGVAYDGAEEDATLAPFVADNDRPWTGGEASVDPAAIEGVLVASVPLRAEGDGALDVRVLAPTVLSLLGVEVPGELDLAPLEVR